MATKNTPTGKSTKAQPKSTPAKAAPSKAAASKEKATTTKAANINPAPKSTKESKATESKATETKSIATAAAAPVKEPVAAPKAKQEATSAPAIDAKKGKIAITAEHIAVRAYLIWQERGFDHGGDVNDWLRAEAELNSLN